MSRHEIHQAHHISNEPPTQQVRDEAQKIIGIMDSTGQNVATQAREALLKDLQTMTPKDSRDLLMTVMNQETKYKGVDLELFGHSNKELKDFNAQTDRERENLGKIMQQATPEQRKAAFADFNKEHQKELDLYKKEVVVQIAKEREVTDEEKKRGIGIVTIGDPVTVATYRSNADGLPDFKIVGK